MKFKLFIVLINLFYVYANVYDGDIGDSCIDRLTGEKGECKLLADCPIVYNSWKYVDDENRPSICGFNEKTPIVCCVNKIKIDLRQDLKNNKNNHYINFNESCYNEITKSYGIIKRSEYCSDELNVSPACSYDVCDGLVCCPFEFCGNDRNCGNKPIEEIINTRLSNNFDCIVPGSSNEGVYTNSEECSYYDDLRNRNISLPKSCDWKTCENYVCCPKTHLNNTKCANGKEDSYFHNSGPCIVKSTGQQGICTFSKHCPSQFGTDYDQLTICGTNCQQQLICCPEPNLQILTISEIACVKYRSTVYEDFKTAKILPQIIDENRDGLVFVSAIGGEFADIKEFPHMTVLGYEVQLNKIEWNCGGSLISERFVLTAAHCLQLDDIPVSHAKVGIIDIQDTECECSKSYRIIERIAHPEYRIRIKYHDIALLKLDRNVIFRTDIHPICLPTSPEIPQYLKAVGFGETSINGILSNRLIKVDLEFFTHKECNESFKYNFNSRFNGIREDTQFCAGSREEVMDTCRGDSGGPIQWDHPNYNSLAIIHGVTSFGRACGFVGQPGIYTTVYPYIKWIESIVWQ